MNKRSAVYLALGIVQIITGIFGSFFVFIVSGTFMLFKTFSDLLKNAKKPLQIVVSVLFTLINLYYVYYSSLMLISEIDYASFRPETWIIIPISLTLIVFIALLLFTADSVSDAEKPLGNGLLSLIDSSVEDFTVFALVFIGWIGTYVFEFFFEYAAAFCITVCALKNIYDLVFTKQQTQTTPTQHSAEEDSLPETEQTVKET
ncbi:MAG: hypothetical protein J5816_02175 [Clostridia bacterium]|nr:hypothetical protein [Clostridia bacterium]